MHLISFAVLWQHMFQVVVCVLGAVQRTAPSTHTTTWNTCCHNTAKLI